MAQYEGNLLVDMEEIPCTIGPTKLVKIDSTFKSGCGICDISFPIAVHVSRISFVNSYTASVTVQGRVEPDEEQSGYFPHWKTLVKDYILMNRPHYEENSQSSFQISLDESQETDKKFIGLRLILRQPSPHWINFSVTNIVCYQKLRTNSEDFENEDCQISRLKHQLTQSGFDCESISSHLDSIQNMMKTLMQCPEAEEATKFDVDGSYDINLLSYT